MTVALTFPSRDRAALADLRKGIRRGALDSFADACIDAAAADLAVCAEVLAAYGEHVLSASPRSGLPTAAAGPGGTPRAAPVARVAAPALRDGTQ